MQTQSSKSPQEAPRLLRQTGYALGRCNRWHDVRMTAEEPTPEQQAAMDELDQLSTEYAAALEALEKAREKLSEAAIRHLRDRRLRPKEVDAHVPWDRNYVAKIAREAGVPPLREPTVRSRRRSRST